MCENVLAELDSAVVTDELGEADLVVYDEEGLGRAIRSEDRLWCRWAYGVSFV